MDSHNRLKHRSKFYEWKLNWAFKKLSRNLIINKNFKFPTITQKALEVQQQKSFESSSIKNLKKFNDKKLWQWTIKTWKLNFHLCKKASKFIFF